MQFRNMSALRATNRLLGWSSNHVRKLAQSHIKYSNQIYPSCNRQWRSYAQSSHNLLIRPLTNAAHRFFSSVSEQRPEQKLDNSETGPSPQAKKNDGTPQNANKIKVIFICADGRRLEGYGKEGDNLLDVVVNNEVDLDGFGACEGTLSCSTCHLIFSQEDYDKIDSKPTDEELDMLDLAYELTDTSRLGCQVTLRKDMDGIEVRVPATVNDARAS